MRIGIDVSCLETARTGVRTYLQELTGALDRAGADVVQLHPPPRPTPASRVQKVARHFRHQRWIQSGLPRAAARERCDVLLGPEYESPLRSPCPRVVVFHDANFWLNPHHYNPLWRALMNLVAVPAARSAARIITVSSASRSDLARALGIPETRFAVVPEAPGTAVAVTPGKAVALLDQLGLTRGRFFLHVGVLEKRKNLVRLIDAFASIAAELPHALVLAGQPGPKVALDDSAAIRKAIAERGLRDRVTLTGFVPGETLAALYGAACATVYPSLYEGFGLPVLEGFQYDSPVICSNTASLPEVAGDAALLIDPTDVRALAEAMRAMACDADLRRRYVAAGRSRLAQFSWDRTARATLAVLEAAARC